MWGFRGGRPFRILPVADTFTRECPLLAADTSLTGQPVSELLHDIAAERGYPKTITVDNGTEPYSKAVDSRAYRRGVPLQFIRPGKPVENVFIESFRDRVWPGGVNAVRSILTGIEYGASAT